MKLPPEILEKFRQHGRKGGQRRAAVLSPEERRAVAVRAATARWIRHRFGASNFTSLGMPGSDIVDAGLADLADGKVTIESLAVSIAEPRLRREGIPVPDAHAEPEEALYELISRSAGDLAHARYGAVIRQITSFADACRATRVDRIARAT